MGKKLRKAEQRLESRRLKEKEGMALSKRSGRRVPGSMKK